MLPYPDAVAPIALPLYVPPVDVNVVVEPALFILNLAELLLNEQLLVFALPPVTDEILAVVVYSLSDALTPLPLVVKFTVSELTPVN